MMKKILLFIGCVWGLLVCPALAWRSELYPENWMPPGLEKSFYTDKLIQDFSYAGYKRGEELIPNVTGPIFDVTDPAYGADPTGTSDSTVAIQAAIDAAAAAGGGVVYLPAGEYLVEPIGSNAHALRISTPNIVLRGAGVGETFILNTSYQMRSKAVILVRPPSTSTSGSVALTADLEGPTRRIPVANASAFAVGDIVRMEWEFTQEWIDEHNQGEWWGETGSGFPANARYLREVMAVNTSEGWIDVDIPTRYTMKTRDSANVRKVTGMLTGVGLENFSIGNVQHPGTEFGEADYNSEGTAAWDTHASWLISVRNAYDSWISGVESYQHTANTTTCHMLSNGISFIDSFRNTIQNAAMRRAQYGGGGGNAYMYRIQHANDNLIKDSIADFSRHGFVISHAGTSGNVFRNCEDRETRRATGSSGSYETSGSGSDHHMHFSHSNLFDGSHAHNSYWEAQHRIHYGTVGHGLTSAHGVYWNMSGSGTRYSNIVISEQGRYGYVIGTSGTRFGATNPTGGNTAPADHLEGIGTGDTLSPQSLSLDQFAKRMQGVLVFAGDDVMVAPNAAYSLGGAAYTYGSGPLVHQWSQVSGPTATFMDANALETTVDLTEEGEYVLKLTAWDGGTTNSATVTIIVDEDPTFTVSYDANDATSGTAPADQTKAFGVDLVLATNSGNLAKTGYVFSGWNTAANGGGTDYAAGATYTGNADLALYAKWSDTQVYLTASQPFNHPDGWADPAYWSDELPAGAGKDYAVYSGRAVHTPNGTSTQTFPGASLTLGDSSSTGILRLNRTSTGARTTVVNNLQVVDGRFETTNWNTLHTVQTGSGEIPVAASLVFNPRASDTANSGFIIDAALTGTDVVLTVQGREELAQNNQVRFQRANPISGSIRSTSFGNLIVGHADALQNLTLDLQSGDTGIVTFNQNSTLGGLEGAKDINFGGRVLSVGNNNTSTTYSGQISNGSLTKVGTGTLTLAGANTYTGATTINGGVLRVNGSLASGSSVTVNNNGALAGTGTVGGGLTIANGGTLLADGAALTASGAVTLQSGSILDASDIEPEGWDPVVLMHYGSLSGTFSTENVPAGWSVDYAFDGNKIALMPDAPGFYFVTYNGNGHTDGTVPTDPASPYDPDTQVTVLGAGDLARTGYTFSSWNTAANGSGTSYSAGNTFTITTHTTLYAQWTANTYTVTFDQQDGEGGSTSVVATFGSPMPAATAPTRDGYLFYGYFTAGNGGGTQYYTGEMGSARDWDIAGDTTLYADWLDPTAQVVEVLNPYAAVDFDTFEVHLGGFHNHTTRSDGNHTPRELILDYHGRDYTVLAISDHNYSSQDASEHVTHPWEDYTDPPIYPDQLNPIMIDVPASELSLGDHIVSLFSYYNSQNSDVHTRLTGIGNAGGIGYFAHPGRYERSAQWYADHYENHPHIFGQAIYNQGDRYPGDRAKWDDVLSITMPDRPVWGISEDDTHSTSHVARNRTYMFMPSLTHTNVRESLVSGAFYSTYSGQTQTPPSLTGVTVDESAGTITLEAENFTSVRWISMGAEVATGLTIDLLNTPGVDKYVRAEFQGAEGRMYTNPFGVELNIINHPPVVDAGPDQTVFLTLDQPWTPAALPLAAWYDASDTGSLTMMEGKVAAWLDKSGNNNHATQGMGDNRPTFGTTTIGGKDVVSFRVSDQQHLTVANDASLRLDSSGGVNIFSAMTFVSYEDNGSSLNAPMGKGSVTDASHAYGMRTAANTLRFKAGATNSLSATVNHGTTVLFSGVRRDSEEIAELYLDGSFITSRTSANLKNSDNTDPLQIGRDSSSSRYSNVDFGEILIVGGELSTEDRQKIEGYLAHKWGMTGNLPAGHPYKVTAPVAALATATMAGSATDPDGDPLTFLWSKVDGPESTVVFSDLSTTNAVATFITEGVYTLRLTASDGREEAYDEVLITVTPPTTAYTVTFDKQEGTGGSESVIVYEGSPMPAATAPTRTGYTFLGYFTAIDGGGVQYYNADMSSARNWDIEDDATLYAHWEVTTYTVSYNGNGNTGGTAPADQIKDHDVDLTLAAQGTLVRTGYTFAGWNTAADGSGTGYAAGATYAANESVTLYAQWTGNTYTVTFDANEGTAANPATKLVTYGSTYGELPTTSREGYVFTGWFTAASGGVRIESTTEVTTASDHTLHAQWSEIGVYTITYEGNGNTGGTAPADQTKDHDVGLTLAGPGTLVRTGYTFAGWNTAANGSGTSYAAGATYTVNESVTLYAQWTADTYTVTFDRQGGSGGSSSVEVTFGSAMPAATAPTRTGYTFGGYFTEVNGGGTQYYTAAMDSARNWDIAQDTTLYAQWTGLPIVISPEIRHQEMAGFGAALSWYLSSVYRNNETRDAAIEKAMFEDLGLDILRLKNWYYPDDEDSTSAMNSHNINARLYQAAKDANPDIKILYSSWSPPESLKSNGERRNGGTLTKDGNGNFMYEALADYWVEVLDNLGWTPDYLSFQNEPGYTATWETCVFAPTETSSNAGYAEAADAIWNAIKDRPDVPKMVGSEAENMPAFFNFNQQLLSRPYFAVHGYHVYDIGNTSQIDSSTTIGRLNRIRDDFNDRPNWQTEFSREFNWIDAGRVIHNTLVEANASAYIYWKMFWGSDTPESMIEHVNNTSFQINPPYYTVKHYSRHIHKGYERIEVGGSTSDVRVSGFLAPEGNSITIVAINRATSQRAISLLHDALRIESIAGYQSVEGDFYQTMSGLDVAAPILLPASSITTIVLTLADEPAMAVYEDATLIPVDAERLFMAPLDTPVSHTYVVTNMSGARATLLLTNMPDAVVFAENDGTSYNGFTISPNITGDGTELEPGESASFTVTFQTAVAGSYAATVRIANNDPWKNPYTFTVSATVASYTVTYNGNQNTGGTEPAPQPKQHGVDLTLATNSGNLTRTGYTFVGWNTQADGRGTYYAEGATYTANADLTLYAQWNRPPVVDAGSDQTVYLSEGGGEPWTPEGLTLAAWYDASDSDSITLASGRVSQWNDLSGNERHATQGSSGNQPMFNASDALLHDMPTIGYDGIATDLWRYLETPALTFSNVYVVTYYDAAQFDNWRVLMSDNQATVNRIRGTQNNTTFGLAGFRMYRDGASANTNTALPMGPTLWRAEATRDFGDVPWSILGQKDGWWTTWGRGAIGEMIFTDGTEDLATQQMIEGYLAHKWGLEDNLPSDHPYKAAAPGGSSATATLAGYASDPDGDALTTVWTRAEGPAAASFANASVTNTTVTFTEAGTYTLRLTADDGFAQAFDEVVITVNAPGVDTYTVTYDGNDNSGGTTPTDANSPYTADAEVTVLGPGDLEKTGHTFSGWNTAADGSGTSYSAGNIFTITANTTLYAQWTANTYTVTLDQQEGTGGSTSVVATFGSAMPAATPPTRDGYTFQGYFTAVDGGGTQYYHADMSSARNWDVDGQATLYAYWTPIVYEVNFSPVSASGPESTSSVNVTVVLSPAHSETITVEHRLASPGGTATPGVDFAYTPGILTFDPGQTSRSFTFDVIYDDDAKPDRTILFELGEITNAEAGLDTTFTYTIEADTDKWYTVPFRETFEARQLGNLHGQLGWIASEDVVVQSETTFDGSAKAAAITAAEGFMRRTFTDAQTNVWTDVYYQPVFFDDGLGDPDSDATTVLAFNAEGNPMVYNGQTLETLTEVSVSAGEWVRVTIRSDYVAKVWDLYINGELAGENLGFYNAAATAYTEFSLNGAGEGVVPVDDLQIILTSPFDEAKTPASITLGDLSQVYDGTPRAVSVTTDPEGLTVVVTYDGNAWAPTNAGSYAVVATIDDASYQGTTNGTLVISKAIPTATLHITNSPQTYDGSLKTAVVEVAESSVGGSVVNVANGTHTAAGTYPVTADFVPDDTANYETLTGLEAGNFVINKATPTVTAWPTASAIVLGEALSASELSGGSASPSGDFDFTAPATVPESGGTYPASVTFTPNDADNYTTLQNDVDVEVLVMVTFDKNAEEAEEPDPASKPVTVGAAYGDLATTSREGYTFNGWFTAAVDGDPVTTGTVVTATGHHTLYAQWTGEYRLTVISAHGDPVPSVGLHTYDANALVDASQPVSVIEEGYTQYVVTGWTGTGSGLTGGTGTNVSFTITEDTTLLWQWQTNYWVEFTLEGEDKGSLDAPAAGWYPSGTNLTATATLVDEYRYVQWQGDTDGAQIEDTAFSFTVQAPRFVEAVFLDYVTDDKGIPWWWLASLDPEREEWTPEDFEAMAADTLSEGGSSVWEAYWTGTDPTDASSRFEIGRVHIVDGKIQLEWSHAEDAPMLPQVYIEFSTNLLSGEWDRIGDTTAEHGLNIWDHDDGDGPGYYRLSVDIP